MHICAKSQLSQYKAFNILYFRVERQVMIFKTEALLPALPLKTPELADEETSLVNKPLVKLLQEVLEKVFNLIT